MRCCGGAAIWLPALRCVAQQSAARATITFHLVLPVRATAAAQRDPRYVSLGTQSAVVTLTAQNGTAVAAAQAYAVNINRTSGCAAVTPTSVGRAPQAIREPPRSR
jgi:hypothetical protein